MSGSPASDLTPARVVEEWRRRLASAQDRSQPLARAIGLGKEKWRVLDATAGLCKDSVLLAAWGCELIAMERNAQVYELVRAAIGLASERKDLASIFSRIDFQRQDARDYLRSAPGANLDVIYLDPMYSERHKSALPKKDLQQLRDWVGDDEDAQELFLLAKQSRVKRIVVKRADHAPALAPNVAHSFESKLVRYDLYLP